MSKEVGEMVRSRKVVQAEASARPEFVPMARRPGWFPGAGAAVEREPEARRGAAAAAGRIAGGAVP